MALLDVRHVTFTYPMQTVPAVRDVSFSIEKGEFVTLCGATGSGKTTLLRMLKKEIMPLGTTAGTISVRGVSRDDMDDKASCYLIGYVMQRPEQQLVTDKVWHEMAFGLENMGLPPAMISRRIAEMAAYFGIESWFEKDTATLSGGQKQLLNLASVMVMQPDVLILDEPTAQLDPIAAADFIATVHKINRDLGTTVLICEHRLEDVIPLSDKILVMEKGALAHFDAPEKVIANLRKDDPLLLAMPSAARVYMKTGAIGTCPLTVRAGRQYVENHFDNRIPAPDALPESAPAPDALTFKNVSFRYEKNGRDVLSHLDFSVREGEIMCLLGGNGSGKTTTLLTAAGLLKPYEGDVRVFGKRIREYKNQSLYRNMITMLPQDVQTLFLCHTVEEELKDARAECDLMPIDLTPLLHKHPYDLSGGEQQLVGLAKVLSSRPRILLMDEPTKGVDAFAKDKLIGVLKALKQQGMTLLIVTHDVEFAAQCADRCAMFFHGNIASVGTPRPFFGENTFYTTAVSRMTRGYYRHAVTVDELSALCLKNGRKGDMP